MKIIEVIQNNLKTLSDQSKLIIKCGLALCVILYTLSVVYYIAAGRGADYYTAMRISSELAECISPSLAVLALGVVMFESVSQSST